MKVNIGRMLFEGRYCGFVKWQEGDHQFQLISIPYGSLLAFRDQERIPTTPEHVWIWTKAAGALGPQDMVNNLIGRQELAQ